MKLDVIATGLAKQFAAYKDQLANATGQLKSVQAEITDALQRRRAIRCELSSRDEFYAATCAIVDRLAAEGQARRQEYLTAWSIDESKRRRPRFGFPAQFLAWPKVKAVIDGDEDFGFSGLPFLLAAPADGGGGNFLSDGPAICAVLGGAIKDNLKTFFSEVEWPAEKSIAEREARIKTIELRLADLRDLEAQLIKIIGDNTITAVEDL